MKNVLINPVWTFTSDCGTAMPHRLIELLVLVHTEGTLQGAAEKMGLSYRHTWELVRLGERLLETPLLRMQRGKGSSLTELGKKIVWANHRIQTRLGPLLDSIASEITQEMSDVMGKPPALLHINADPGFAISLLVAQLKQSGLNIAVNYSNGISAVAALVGGTCNVAGLHVPIGKLEEFMLSSYKPWLKDGDFSVLSLSFRRMGLMVMPGNPKEIFDLTDIARPDVRFLNRDAGSGPRWLLERLLGFQGIDPAKIANFEQGEPSHAAVAACIASGMADAGFGLEPPVRRFQLDFVPLVSERYFLLFRTKDADSPAILSLINEIRNPAFIKALGDLPGYDASIAGCVSPLRKVFPSLNGGENTEDRRQNTGDRRQGSEAWGSRAEDRRQGSEARGSKAEDRN